MIASTPLGSNALAAASLVLGIGLCSHAVAQDRWQSAVAEGTYAVYSVNREQGGVETTAEYFLQSFAPDGAVAITHHLLNAPAAAEGERRASIITEGLCEGRYTPNPGGIHGATCGDNTYALLVIATEVIDGRQVMTAMRGVNQTAGAETGEAFEYVYRRLPDGFENAIMAGTYAAYEDNRDPDGRTETNFFYGAYSAGIVNFHNQLATNPGEQPGTRVTTENGADWIIRNYVANQPFAGIHQAVRDDGRVQWEYLVLGVEEIDGRIVVTEFRGLGATGTDADLPQWHFYRLGD